MEITKQVSPSKKQIRAPLVIVPELSKNLFTATHTCRKAKNTAFTAKPAGLWKTFSDLKTMQKKLISNNSLELQLIKLITHTPIMKNQETTISPDLQQFINIFQPNKFKLLTRGIEVRGISNMHNTITQAKNLIERLGLKLTIQHNAEMLSYGGFEVNNEKSPGTASTC